MSDVHLTILSDMAGHNVPEQLDQATLLGLKTLDLKTVFGKNIADISDSEADQLAVAMAGKGIGAQALSTHLFKIAIESGEAAFAAQLKLLNRVLTIARRVKPKMIRLIAAETIHRGQIKDSWQYISSEQPWLLPIYGEAINRIHSAGFSTVIENETGQSIFTAPHEIAGFFTALGMRDRVSFTWDVQNLWQLGTYPTMDVYHLLRPYIGYLHLKGGIADTDDRTLKYCSTLESASWPVVEITKAVIADRVSPVICLNPSHGVVHPDHSMDQACSRDLAFLRLALAPDVV